MSVFGIRNTANLILVVMRYFNLRFFNSELLEYVIDESFDIQKTFYQDQPMLIFILPVQERTRSRHFAVGITTGENGEISYNFTWVDE